LPLEPSLLSFHLLVLIINHDCAIHQRLEIRISIRHQLELQSIIESLEETALLILVICHIIRSVTR
jgi:hypothetical protein